MILRNKLFFTFCCFFTFCALQIGMTDLYACKKKTTAPSWVNTHLSDPNYFIGIGQASIIKKENSHIERARKDALNELASEISVNIFSSNMLVTLVTNDKIYDEFNSMINARVRTDIEGYELVDSFKDKKEYWVYYRLSKQRYYEDQAKKRAAATQNALAFYQLALAAKATGNDKSALINYAKTIDAVKLYLNDHILAEIDGKEENIVVNAYSGITSILTNLRFAYPYQMIQAIVAQDIKSEYLNFKLINHNQETVTGFPILIHYSERAISPSNQITNAEGQVQFSIPKVKSKKSEEVVTVSIDINTLLLESSADYTVRRAILDIPLQTIAIPVYISKPSISFTADERSFNQPMNDGIAQQTFMDLSYAADYPIVRTNADYQCFITVNTTQENALRGIYNVVLKGQIVLKDKDGNIRYSVQISPIKGTQLSPERASQDAYKNLEKAIKNRYFREIEEAILK